MLGFVKSSMCESLLIKSSKQIKFDYYKGKMIKQTKGIVENTKLLLDGRTPPNVSVIAIKVNRINSPVQRKRC